MSANATFIVSAPKGQWHGSIGEMPPRNHPKNISKDIYRENLAAAIAASECGTAKLERIMMLMNDELRTHSLPLGNT